MQSTWPTPFLAFPIFSRGPTEYPGEVGENRITLPILLLRRLRPGKRGVEIAVRPFSWLVLLPVFLSVAVLVRVLEGGRLEKATPGSCPSSWTLDTGATGLAPRQLCRLLPGPRVPGHVRRSPGSRALTVAAASCSLAAVPLGPAACLQSPAPPQVYPEAWCCLWLDGGQSWFLLFPRSFFPELL